jgi:hypothetical protein
LYEEQRGSDSGSAIKTKGKKRKKRKKTKKTR